MPFTPRLQLPPTLIVSIHDVSPLTLPTVQAMAAEMRALGVGKLSYLVTPDHHRKGPVAGSPETQEWLRTEQAVHGAEMVLHGYYHLREPRTAEGLRRETPWDRLITRSYTAGEGEFYDLPQAEAANLLAQGREMLQAAGLRLQGFIAPAWLLGADAEVAVRDAGFCYTTRLGYLRDLQRDCDFPAQSLCWSVRSAWRRQASLLWNDYLLVRESRSPLVRIGLHPVDYAHPPIWRQIRQLTSRALEARTPRTYAEFCEAAAAAA